MNSYYYFIYTQKINKKIIYSKYNLSIKKFIQINVILIIE